MKKYIIGLFSAICLMWAGCEQFEDYIPVDMGEGPAVTINLEKTDVDAFTLTVTPAEGAAYYAYLITNEAITANSDTLLQAKYANAVPLKTAENPSVTESFVNQKIGVTYYVYAVASDAKGVCGAIVSATLDLPDEEAPHIVDASYMYTPTNNSRTITVTFNEEVIRGTGAITYSLNTMNSDNTFNVYKSGTFESENVVIDGTKVAITLPEDAVYNETENTVTFVFLNMEKGAFVDASGNESPEMAGFDEDSAPLFPWWQYVPRATGGDSDIVIEIDESKGAGIYVFFATSIDEAYPEYVDILTVYPGETVAQLTGEAYDHDYGFMGFGYAYSDDNSKFALFGGDISDDGATLNIENSLGTDGYYNPSCEIPLQDGSRTYFFFVVGTYDSATQKVSIVKESTIPFVQDSNEPLKLNTDKVILCLVPKDEKTLQCIDVLFDPYIIPYRLVSFGSVAKSFVPTINRQMEANAIKSQVNSMKNLKFKPFLRK